MIHGFLEHEMVPLAPSQILAYSLQRPPNPKMNNIKSKRIGQQTLWMSDVVLAWKYPKLVQDSPKALPDRWRIDETNINERSKVSYELLLK